MHVCLNLTCSTLLVLLFAIAVFSRPIYLDKLQVNLPTSMVDENNKSALRSADGDDTGDTRVEKKDLYRTGGGDNINPKFVFGKEFNEVRAKQICESTAIVRGGKLDVIRFSTKGEHLCKMACKSLGMSILTIKPTILMLVDKYCTRERLKPVACVCDFKLLCQEKIYHAFITVIPNIGGGITMSFSEAGRPPKTNSILNP